MFKIDDDVPPPPRKNKLNGKRGSKYPFDQLGLNQSFHIPKTDENPNPAHSIHGTVSSTNRKYRTPILDDAGKPVTKTVTFKKYEKDDHRRCVLGPDGKLVFNTVSVEQPTFVQDREFCVERTSADDPGGVGARIWRIK